MRTSIQRVVDGIDHARDSNRTQNGTGTAPLIAARTAAGNGVTIQGDVYHANEFINGHGVITVAISDAW
jgi:hypothetical protein